MIGDSNRKIKEIIYDCPHCRRQDSIKGEQLYFQLPDKLKDGEDYTILAPCSKFAGISLLHFTRTSDIASGNASRVDSLLIGSVSNYASPDAGIIAGKKVAVEGEVLSLSPESLFFRSGKVYKNPIDPDIEAKNKDLIGAPGTYKKILFINPSRRNKGYFYINNPGEKNKDNEERGVVFVSTTHQSTSSLDMILSGLESASAVWISRKQDKYDSKRKLPFEDVNVRVMLPSEDIKHITGLQEQHFEKFYNEVKHLNIKNPVKEQNIHTIAKSAGSAIGFGKGWKRGLKMLGKKALIGIAISLFPLAGIPFAIAGVAKAANTIKTINSSFNHAGLEAEISQLTENINSEKVELDAILNHSNYSTVEEYKSELVDNPGSEDGTIQEMYNTLESSMNTSYNNIDESSLTRLDNFFKANGATPVDADLDGFTDHYRLADGTIIDNPFSIIEKGVDMSAEDYEQLLAAWDNLQDYESHRSNFNAFENETYNPYVENLAELEALINGRINVQDYLTIKLGELASTETQLGIVASVLAMLGISAGASIITGYYLSQKSNKLNHGSKLPPLSSEQLSRLFKHHIQIKSVEVKELTLEEITKKPSATASNESKIKSLEKSNELLLGFKNTTHISELGRYLGGKDINELVKKFEYYNNAFNFMEETPEDTSNAYKTYLIGLKDYLITSLKDKLANLPPEIQEYNELRDEINLIKNMTDNEVYSVNFIEKLNKKYPETIFENSSDKNNFINLTEEQTKHIISWASCVHSINSADEIFKERDALIDIRIGENNKLKQDLINESAGIQQTKKAEVTDRLIADPQLIFSEVYEHFGGENNDDIKSVVLTNFNDFKKVRKVLKKGFSEGRFSSVMPIPA